MPGPWVDLSVAARLAARAFATRLRGDFEPPPDLDAFESGMQRAIEALPAGIVRSHRWLSLPATEPPWRDTGIDLEPGTSTSYFAAGRVYASRPLDIWVTPKTQIWGRVGEKGTILSSARDSNTIECGSDTTPSDRRLFFGNYFPNDWRDPHGARIQDDKVYGGVSGETRIVVVTWNVPVREGLAALLREADPLGLVSGELERLEQRRQPPNDWRYLWNIGDGEAFHGDLDPSGRACIDCHVHGDVGILQKDVDVPLTADTELSWTWKVDRLPGVLREDSVPSHDYLSIAVEFDNGWDLTYYWSKALPVETGFICPLPNWQHREYHVVVRSGDAGLGETVAERRNVHRDYERYMRNLGAPPTRIVRVWLIANSVFMRQEGACRYSDIRLHDGHDEWVVL